MNTILWGQIEIDNIKNHVFTFLADYGFSIIGAIIILTIGAFVARWLGRVADAFFVKKQVEPPARLLAVRVLRLLVFGLAAVLASERLGVPIAPVIAGISVAGVGIGLAMQGVLGNLVAGLTIIFTKPFRVGEYIEIAGENGQVTDVQLFSTTLIHTDRSRVVIPNRKIVGEILHNYGTIRQLDLSVGVGYSTNVGEALALIRELLARNSRVKQDPVPVVGITSLGDSSVNIAIKPWVAVPDYNSVAAELNQAVLETFRAKQIEIPFPQREVRLLGGGNGAETLAAASVLRGQ